MSAPRPKKPVTNALFTDDLIAEEKLSDRANPDARSFLERLYAIADALYGIPQMGKKDKRHLTDFSQ